MGIRLTESPNPHRVTDFRLAPSTTFVVLPGEEGELHGYTEQPIKFSHRENNGKAAWFGKKGGAHICS